MRQHTTRETQSSLATARHTRCVSAHQALIASAIAAFVVWGVPLGLYFGARRAARGRLPLGAPATVEKAKQLRRIGEPLVANALLGVWVVGTVAIVLLVAALLT